MIKEFFKENKTGLIISTIVVSLSGFFLYIKDHSGYAFNIIDYVLWMPIYLVLFFVMVYGMNIFLEWGTKKSDKWQT